ncbi:MAG: hypothetical protein B7Z33_09350 [Sphingomonadales bacterium 12-68-11]|nr:MAG: hypothetical protein B7Z33_09350 [Sphingomonadales bacterium 12-68-11]
MIEVTVSPTSLALGRALPGGGPTPTTSAFGYGEIAAGFTLLHDDASDATKCNFPADGTQSRAAIWCGVVTGSAASVKLKSRYPGAELPVIRVTINGGAITEYAAGPESDFYTLFSALSDAAHFVTFQFAAPRGYCYMPTDEGAVLKVTGAAPAVAVAGEWAVAGDEASKHVMPGGRIASRTEDFGSWLGAGRNPLLRPAWDGDGASGSGRTGHQPLIRFRTSATELWVVGQSAEFALLVGGALTIHDTGKPGNAIGADAVRATRVTGLAAGDKTISLIAASDVAPPGQWLAVGVPAEATFVTVASPARAHLFGDSITQGVPAGSYGQEEMSLKTDGHRAFGALGFAVGNFAIAGTTWGNLADTIGGFLSHLPAATSADVAFVAQGQNAVPEASQIEAVLGALVAKGYGKIVVRGVLPVLGNGHQAANAVIAGTVGSFAAPNVAYIDPDGWTELAAGGADFRPDGIHFAPLGYDAILARMNVALPLALA